MAEAPKGELFFDIDEFFGHFVGVPVVVGVGIDFFESGGNGVIRFVRLAEVAADAGFGDGESLSVEVEQEFVVDARGIERCG